MLWMFACTLGPATETLVDELRVLTVLADPAEAAPGESVALQSWVVDPLDTGFEAITWACTPTGSACLEQGASSWAGALTHEGVGAQNILSSTHLIDPAVAGAVSDVPAPLIQHFTLACEVGLCPVIAQVRAGNGADWLADPFAGLAELPLRGVSLALRPLWVSSRDASARDSNPTVTCTGAPDAVAPEEEVEITCAITGTFSDEAGLWGYSTGGGFSVAREPVSAEDSEVTLTWFAPTEPGERVWLWAVLVDGRGGVGLWSHELTATEAD